MVDLRIHYLSTWMEVTSEGRRGARKGKVRDRGSRPVGWRRAKKREKGKNRKEKKRERAEEKILDHKKRGRGKLRGHQLLGSASRYQWFCSRLNGKRVYRWVIHNASLFHDSEIPFVVSCQFAYFTTKARPIITFLYSSN